MFLLLLVVAFLQAITSSEGITCGSQARACISSIEYQTCISVDGEYLITDGLVVKCPSGQICSEDSVYPCVDGTDVSSATNSSVCGPLGRACISETDYITCISVDGEYIATTGLVITCPSGQVCKEDTTYPCVDDPEASSASPNCGPLGRKCLSQTEYITCISVDGEYIATTGQIITCPSGEVCREDTTYPCVDDSDTATISSISCDSMGKACISETDYTTCISVNGTYVAMTDQIITCPTGQICKQDTTYPCVDSTVAPMSMAAVVPMPKAAVVCSSLGRACLSSTEYETCVLVDGEYIATTGLTITCPAGQVCRDDTTYPCNDEADVSSSSSSTSTTSTTAGSVLTTTPTCTEDITYPGPQCNQYYHCFYVMWWWSVELLTCPEGQAYDETSAQCVASTTCTV